MDNWEFNPLYLGEVAKRTGGERLFTLLVVDDLECRNKQLVKRLCEETLTRNGAIPLDDDFTVVVYYTDFDVADAMFCRMQGGPEEDGQVVPELERVDGIILDVVEEGSELRRGEMILRALPTLGWSPMPGVLLVTGNKDPDLVAMTRDKGFSNYVFPMAKTTDDGSRSDADDRSLQGFYDYVIKRRHYLDMLGVEYGVVVGRHFREELDEFLALFDLDRERRLPLVIKGDTGTGKELIARRIHAFERWYDIQDKLRTENRSDQFNKELWSSFQPVLMSAISRNVLTSELFGYKEGAFSGAKKDFKGYIQRAEKGTLFIDEVADLTPAAQAGLLRFLQEGKIQVMGEDSERKVEDVRLVFATNKPLDDFRNDFLYRMDGLTFVVKSLAERHENDIRELIDYLVANNLRQYKAAAGDLEARGKPIAIDPSMTVEQFLPQAQRERLMDMVAAGCFPGNIRQLQAYIRRLTLLTRAERPVKEEDFEKASRYSLLPPEPQKKVTGEVQQGLERIFGDWGWNEFISGDRNRQRECVLACQAAGLTRAAVVGYLLDQSLRKGLKLSELTDTRGKPLSEHVVNEGYESVLSNLSNLWSRNRNTWLKD